MPARMLSVYTHVYILRNKVFSLYGMYIRMYVCMYVCMCVRICTYCMYVWITLKILLPLDSIKICVCAMQSSLHI